MSQRGHQLIYNQLRSGERLLWLGRPSSGMRSLEGPVIAAGVAGATGLALIVLYATGISGAWVLTPGTLAIVVVAVISRGLWRVGLASRTWYGLTDQRAMIVSDNGRFDFQSIRLVLMNEISYLLNGDDLGTIRCLSVREGWLLTSKRGYMRQKPLFRQITDGKAVYRMMVDARTRAIVKLENSDGAGASDGPPVKPLFIAASRIGVIPVDSF